MLVAVRSAALPDLPEIRVLFRNSSLSNIGDRNNLLAHPEVLEFAGADRLEECTRVAVVDGRIVGFATAVRCGSSLELEDLFVDPDWMGLGVGRQLVRDLVVLAQVAEVARIEVTANSHAMAFYEKLGFVAAGEATTRFGRAPRMHLDLTQSFG